MRNILLRFEFVGTDFAGWQRQKSETTIQQLIEDAITKVTGKAGALTGCGRTDAGVHAEDYIANFHTESRIPADRFAPALQTKLPASIRLRQSSEVRAGFNARRNSYEKTYRYQIFLGQSVFCHNFWWEFDGELNIEILRACAGRITGRHDFSGFCVTQSRKADNHCVIKQATWRRVGRKLYFRITGDRFLHHMVRFLVGAQVEVAGGKRSFEDFVAMLTDPERQRAKYPAPAAGLYLQKVKFR